MMSFILRKVKEFAIRNTPYILKRAKEWIKNYVPEKWRVYAEGVAVVACLVLILIFSPSAMDAGVKMIEAAAGM